MAHRRYAALPLFLTGVCFVVLAPVFWMMTELPPGQHIPRASENADLYQQVYPDYHYGFGRLRAGALPLWNEKQRCGTPFLADPRHGLFQPLNAVFLLLPTERAMAVHAFLGLFLMGALYVLFARSLDARYSSALLGGVVFAFSGASAGAMSHPSLAGTLAWTPLLFWGLREHVRERRAGPAVVAGLAAGFMLLAGALLLAGVLLLLATGYFMLSLLRPSEAWSGLWRRFRGALIVPAVASGVSAVQWLPSLAWCPALDNPWSVLTGVSPVAVMPTRLADLPAMLVAPPAMPVPALAHFGVLGLAFVPAACLVRRGWLDAIYFLVTGAACLLLTAGSDFWAGAAPLRAALAYPAGFSLAVLVTLGSGRVLGAGKEAGGFRHWTGVLLFLLTATALLLFGNNTARGIMLILLAFSLPVVLLRSRWLSSLMAFAFALLAFFELNNAATNHYEHPFEDAPACYTRHAEILAVADEQALGGRVAISTHPRNPSLIAQAGML